jgi:hypothetical protein
MAKRVTAEGQELFSDAWQRFESAVVVVAKSPPQHRMKPQKKKRIEESVVQHSNLAPKKGGPRPSKIRG